MVPFWFPCWLHFGRFWRFRSDVCFFCCEQNTAAKKHYKSSSKKLCRVTQVMLEKMSRGWGGPTKIQRSPYPPTMSMIQPSPSNGEGDYEHSTSCPRARWRIYMFFSKSKQGNKKQQIIIIIVYRNLEMKYPTRSGRTL